MKRRWIWISKNNLTEIVGRLNDLEEDMEKADGEIIDIYFVGAFEDKGFVFLIQMEFPENVKVTRVTE